MNSQEYLGKIKKYFSLLVAEVNCNTACGHYDINTIVENFYVPIISIIYDCKELENKNVISANYPAIDLGCEITKKSFQVTSEEGSQKIIHTLKKFREHELHEMYDSVYILIITTKQKSYNSTSLCDEIDKQEIEFDSKKHIVDYQNLLGEISNFTDIDKTKKIYELLKKEFDQFERFSVCREELDAILDISTSKIETEKNTKKYIPAIFTEPTKTKDEARLFSNPHFFYRKIEDGLRSLNYDYLNSLLTKMGVDSVHSVVHSKLVDSDFEEFSTLFEYLNELKQYILEEKERILPFNSWSSKNISKVNLEVPEGKEAIKSLLKLKLDMHSYELEREYDNILKQINLCLSKVMLVTSMAGQGKTNFVCDLVENNFSVFEIPSIFIPARELNLKGTTTIFEYITNNRYLNKFSDIYELLNFMEGIAKETCKPFIIVIDGINEVKDLDAINADLHNLINAVDQFEFVRLIVTCRSEFFEHKFKKLLDEPYSTNIHHVQDIKSEMSEANLERVLNSYFDFFNISVELSENASKFLKNDFLLLRIFCELQEGQELGLVTSIQKDVLYEKYITALANNFDEALKPFVITTLFSIVQVMISEDQYAGISLSSLGREQIDVINQLVASDLVLRRDLPNETLMTFGVETIGFTYDELRDFIIAYYLVHQLVKEDITGFKSFIARLHNLQISEGVFKYVYILARKQGNNDVVSICEGFDSFDEHYSVILWSLPSSNQHESDIDKVKKILSNDDSYSALTSTARYLFSRKDTEELLNISILVEHINTLDDQRLGKFLTIMFTRNPFHGNGDVTAINDFIRGGLDKVLQDPNLVNDYAFMFLLQSSKKCSMSLKHRLISVGSDLKERGIKLHCLEFISKSSSKFLRLFVSNIKTRKEYEHG